MECRRFEITLISAKNLEDVRRIGKMKVHARVSIGSDPETKIRTPTDNHGETNPAWNFTLNYMISESMLQNFTTTLVIRLYCTRTLGGDKYIGEVNTSMKELFDIVNPNGGSAVMTLQVQKGCVKSQGTLSISYRFGEKAMIDKSLLDDCFPKWIPC